MNRKAWMSTAIAVLGALSLAAPAMAVTPDRTYDLSSTVTTKSWTSDPYVSVNGFLWYDDTLAVDENCSALGVDPVDKCDVTEVNLDGPGSLSVDLPDAGDGNTGAWSVYVFNGDGEEVGRDDSLSSTLHVDVPEAEGSYLVVAVPFVAAETTYSGEVTFTPAPPQ